MTLNSDINNNSYVVFISQRWVGLCNGISKWYKNSEEITATYNFTVLTFGMWIHHLYANKTDAVKFK